MRTCRLKKFQILLISFPLCVAFMILKREWIFGRTVKIEPLSLYNRTEPTEPIETESIVKLKFNEIYNKGLWGEVGGGSGSGSTVNYTESARSILYEIVKKYGIKSMLDAPCGSFEWMPLILKQISDEYKVRGKRFRYHGVDVVESIINASRIKWANESDWLFSVCDFSAQDLPDNYELIFSRDALQHLSYEKVFYSLRAFSRVKGARLLLVGSYLEFGSNNNIQIGDFARINLVSPPFNLNQYIRVYYESRSDIRDPLKSLILYDVRNYLSKVDFEQMKADLKIN